MAREIQTVQSYQDRMLKLIPTEIVGAYMALQGVVPPAYAKWATLIAGVLLVALTPLYLTRLQQVRRTGQVVMTTIAVVVWLYTLGGPFQYWGLYQPWIGSVLLVLWTLIVPLAVNPKTGAPAPA
ncbi:MAG: hypothetical protein AB1439_11960 [candidate division FCPU426 bacterium]